MARLLRVALVLAAVAGAFAGGYLVKHSSSFSWAAAKPVGVGEAAPAKAVTHTTVLAHRTMAVTATAPHTRTVARTVKVADLAPPPMPSPPAEPSTILQPPIAVGEPARLEPVDPNDPALRMIRDAMGIKTTVLEKGAPPPLVLADAKRDAEPAAIAPPVPMAGPPPKLESPRIDLDLPPMIPAPPASRPVPLLNSRAVELDFEVTRAGLSKVKAVELWATRDGGTTWTRTDRMDGARPPFRARLGGEGEYGFRMVFESEAGMRTPDPKPGQAPDLMMELDTTAPHIVIYSPVAGPPGTIELRWQMTDKNLDRDPTAVRLEYSVDGQTWERIERPTAGPGQTSHQWTLPPGVPPRVLFRVIARDKAGNVATAVTTEKMSVDLVAPEGKVTGVRVQGREPEKGPMPRVVRTGGAAEGLIPAVLRSILPVILGSPVLFPSVGGPALPILNAPWDWDVREDEVRPILPPIESNDGSGCYSGFYVLPPRPPIPFVSPKEWVADLLKTDVVEERPVWTYERLNPFAVPSVNEMLPAEAERFLAQLYCRVKVLDPTDSDTEPGLDCGGTQAPQWARYRPHERTLLRREWQQAAEATFRVLTRGETVMSLLTDRDWKPTAAPPDAYRLRVRTAGRDRPIGGAYDTGPDYWDKPGIGILFEF
jgi:hypothetical protein